MAGLPGAGNIFQNSWFFQCLLYIFFFLFQVMAHLMQIHKSITTLQGEDIVFLATDINLPGAVDWVMMQSCFGHHFM